MNFSKTRCPKCGLEHDRLGIRIAAGLLYRRAVGRLHMVRAMGGGWAFSAPLIEKHHDEIDKLLIIDDDGAFYRASIDDLDAYGQRITLDAMAGAQIFLGLAHWKMTGAPSKPKAGNAGDLDQLRPPLSPADREASRAVQDVFGSGLPVGEVYYRKATQPRPRRPQRRGH